MIPEAEQELSKLLNNVGIRRQTKHPVVLAQEYLSQVHRLINSLQRLYQDQPEAALRGDFSHIKIVIKWWVLPGPYSWGRGWGGGGSFQKMENEF